MGAWIETSDSDCVFVSVDVAPRVGAWIETPIDGHGPGEDLSHPAWVRGLKRFGFGVGIGSGMSHPAWVRGLKRTVGPDRRDRRKSHPAWVRGLKPSVPDAPDAAATSYPAWVRGLKQITEAQETSLRAVAPRVGAWIETSRISERQRHQPRVGAWIETTGMRPKRSGRTPRGCVD